jgi:hypothetical protein
MLRSVEICHRPPCLNVVGNNNYWDKMGTHRDSHPWPLCMKTIVEESGKSDQGIRLMALPGINWD